MQSLLVMIVLLLVMVRPVSAQSDVSLSDQLDTLVPFFPRAMCYTASLN